MCEIPLYHFTSERKIHTYKKADATARKSTSTDVTGFINEVLDACSDARVAINPTEPNMRRIEYAANTSFLLNEGNYLFKC